MTQHDYDILLIGDSCIDEYYYGSCDRLNPEAPVPVLNVIRHESKLGMAANVKDNLESFGCNVNFISGDKVSVKKRYIDERSKQHIVRVDEDRISDAVDLSKYIFNQYNAIVISDYNKGAVSYDTITELRAKFNGPIFIDSKKPDLAKFEGCFVKINELEHKSKISRCSNLIVTMGNRGALYKNVLYPCAKTEVVDVCGAGDTFLAALVAAYLRTLDMKAAINFANRAAAISIGHHGVYSLTASDIRSIIV